MRDRPFLRPINGLGEGKTRMGALYGLGRKSWEKLNVVVRDVRQEAFR